jgi:hypothetical protein
MTKDSNNCKCHSSAVTKRISNEDFTWELIVFKKGQASTQEWNHNRKRKHMIINYFLGSLGIWILINDNFNNVVNHDEAADYETLSNFKSINSSIDINSICAKDSDVTHIEVV